MIEETIILPGIETQSINSFTSEFWFKFTSFPTLLYQMLGTCDNLNTICDFFSINVGGNSDLNVHILSEYEAWPTSFTLDEWVFTGVSYSSNYFNNDQG